MLEHLLEPLPGRIFVRKLTCVLCEEAQIVRPQERHHDGLFVDHALLLVLLLGVRHDLRLVAVEAVLQTVQGLVEVLHLREELLRGLLDDEFGRHPVLLADLDSFDGKTFAELVLQDLTRVELVALRWVLRQDLTRGLQLTLSVVGGLIVEILACRGQG